jgi:hypothetical protein
VSVSLMKAFSFEGVLCKRPKRIQAAESLAFSSVRNSLHFNGIHRNESFTVEIQGVKFEFVKGKPVHSASLGHGLILIDSIVKILEEVIETEKVQNLKGFVPDPFASEDIKD